MVLPLKAHGAWHDSSTSHTAACGTGHASVGACQLMQVLTAASGSQHAAARRAAAALLADEIACDSNAGAG